MRRLSRILMLAAILFSWPSTSSLGAQEPLTPRPIAIVPIDGGCAE